MEDASARQVRFLCPTLGVARGTGEKEPGALEGRVKVVGPEAWAPGEQGAGPNLQAELGQGEALSRGRWKPLKGLKEGISPQVTRGRIDWGGTNVGELLPVCPRIQVMADGGW